MGLIRHSCGHISGHYEQIPIKFGLWMFFIMLHWYLVSKTLKYKQKRFFFLFFFCFVFVCLFFFVMSSLLYSIRLCGKLLRCASMVLSEVTLYFVTIYGRRTLCYGGLLIWSFRFARRTNLGRLNWHFESCAHASTLSSVGHPDSTTRKGPGGQPLWWRRNVWCFTVAEAVRSANRKLPIVLKPTSYHDAPQMLKW